jgi:hypothetical protein
VALDIALDNAPYGPNVEEAKVRLLLGGTVQCVIMHKVWAVPLWDSEKLSHNA